MTPQSSLTQGEAGPHGLAVEQDRARPAHAVLAREVGAGEMALVTQGVGEGGSVLDQDLPPFAVHAQLHMVFRHRMPP